MFRKSARLRCGISKLLLINLDAGAEGVYVVRLTYAGADRSSGVCVIVHTARSMPRASSTTPLGSMSEPLLVTNGRRRVCDGCNDKAKATKSHSHLDPARDGKSPETVCPTSNADPCTVFTNRTVIFYVN